MEGGRRSRFCLAGGRGGNGGKAEQSDDASFIEVSGSQSEDLSESEAFAESVPKF